MHHTAESTDRAGEARLIAFLSRHGITTELVRPGVPMPTVPLAAAAIGVDECQIIKSVLFLDGNGAAVLAIASGSSRIDRRRLAEIAGTGKLRLADAPSVLAITGYPAGGVSPIGHEHPVIVVIDRPVMAIDQVYGGAGSEESLLRISPTEIQRLTGARIADITENAS